MVTAAEVWKPAKTDKSERLLQLTCALIFAERGLTKSELFRAISAYAQAPKTNDEDSLNRMFERDKTDLRSSGIKVEIIDPLADADDLRYAIANDSFVWPQQIELTPKQLQLLNLASQVWARASLKSEASQALVRLRALGIAPSAEDLIGFAPRIQTHEPGFGPLNLAIDEQTEVSFSYRKPTGEISVRNVQPWALKNIDGQWLLQCFDTDAAQPRNFLLRRIVSKIKVVKAEDKPVAFPRPEQADLDAASLDLEDFISRNVAEIRVKRDSQAWFHFHLDDDIEQESTLVLQYMDLHLLAEELRNFALDIRVIRPRELDEAIKSGFAKVVADHA